MWQDLLQIREKAPLIHNITNYVVMNSTANALIAMGASPVMAHALEEVEELAGQASAVILNIGTLSPTWVDAMVLAGRTANQRGIPLILDPVGCGATSYRGRVVQMLIHKTKPDIIRGNASEISALRHTGTGGKGVDSLLTPDEIASDATALSKATGAVVSVSGPVDLIAKNDKLIRVGNGHPLMSKVTGMGCTASALTGAFAAVNASNHSAAAYAMALMGIAGEIAGQSASGPGSFWCAFLDALATIGEQDVAQRIKTTAL